MEMVVAATKGLIYDKGLHAGEVAVVPRREFTDDAREALERLGEPLTRLECASGTPPEILVTAQAFPHTDPAYAGHAFLSLVLHTGPTAYLMETFHVGRSFTGEPDAFTSARVISTDDWFVFDPTTPHFAAPLHPHEDSLLILLQLELSDQDRDDRKAILRELPPRERDRNIEELSFL